MKSFPFPFFFVFSAMLAFLFCVDIYCVPIHDEAELIGTIKKLHEDFRHFNDVLEYINLHCESLQDRKKIKSVIKNQIAQFRNDLDSRVGSETWGSLGLFFWELFCAVILLGKRNLSVQKSAGLFV